MTDYTDRLQDAVDALCKPRHTSATRLDDEGKWAGISIVENPPLLLQLINGTGGSAGIGKSADPGIPIDADRLEIWKQVCDHLRAWDSELRFGYLRDDLVASTVAWHAKHAVAVRDGHVTEVIDHDMTLTVESWVRMIERKFEPDEIRDWTDPCPVCGKRRIVVDEHERFAIRVNVTQITAECANPDCGSKWVGMDGLKELRYYSNLAATRREETLDGNTAIS